MAQLIKLLNAQYQTKSTKHFQIHECAFSFEEQKKKKMEHSAHVNYCFECQTQQH